MLKLTKSQIETLRLVEMNHGRGYFTKDCKNLRIVGVNSRSARILASYRYIDVEKMPDGDYFRFALTDHGREALTALNY